MTNCASNGPPRTRGHPHGWKRLSILFGAAGLAAGCASHEIYPVDPEKSALPAIGSAARVTALTAKVGLYVHDDLRGKHYTRKARYSSIAIPVGETVVPYLEWATRNLFSDVVPMNVLALDRIESGELGGIIELKDATIGRWQVVLHSAATPPIEWQIQGVSWADWRTEGQVRIASLELRDALAQFLVDFGKDQGRAAWLAGVGVAAGKKVEPDFGDAGSGLGEKIVMRGDEAVAKHCFKDRLAGASPSITFVPMEEFRAAMFPWFEYSTEPKDADAMTAFALQPAIRSRMRALGVRHYLEFDGGTTGKGNGGAGCGMYGCLGAGGGTRTTSYRLNLIDLWNGNSVMAAKIEESSAFVTGIFLFVPLYVSAPTEARACERIASTLRETLKK